MFTLVRRAVRSWMLPSLCSVSLTLAGSVPSGATEYTWKPGSGLWATPSRWNPLFGPPNAGDSAVIANWIDDTIYQATLGADVLGTKSPNQLSIGNHGRLVTDGYQMEVSGPTYLFNNGSQLYINAVATDQSAWGFESTLVDLTAGAMLRLNDGRLRAGEVVLHEGSILINGNSRIQATTQILVGDGAGSYDANLIVGAGEQGTLLGPVRFKSDADVTVGQQGELRIGNNATFSGGRYQGNGLLRLDGATNVVSADTTIDMPSGRVDLDGTEDPFAAGQTLVVNSDFTINAMMLDDAKNTFGTSRLVGKDTIQINQWGKLGVNLTNANTSWTMNGHLDVKAVTGLVISNNISGSTMFLKGTANVQGNSAWSARVDVAGTIDVEADSYLRFSGGDFDAPNWMSGGTIQGQGILGSVGGRKLSGYGTINTEIDFIGDSELRAANGTLTLGPSSKVLHVGTIGTDNDTGILDVQHEWNTKVATESLELRGGEVRGGKLINEGRTRGHGRLASNAFVNRGVLEARGGVLRVNTVNAPDLDGDEALHPGVVLVEQGNLLVEKPLNDSFNGEMIVFGFHWATFEQGWRLEHSPISFLPTGVLHLNGSHAFQGAAGVGGGNQELAGIVNVDQVGAFDAPTQFLSTVQVNLPDDQDWLELRQPSTIAPGATFTGNGQLHNFENSELLLRSNAYVGVDLVNHGKLAIEDGVGDARVEQLISKSTARLELSIKGTGSTSYETLRVDDAARLDGALQIRTDEPGSTYADPTMRGQFDLFTLIEMDDRLGSFSDFYYNGVLLEPTTYGAGLTARHHVGNGLFRNITYRNDHVRLTNYLAISGDASGDGSFDSTDFIIAFQAGEYEDAIAQNSDWTEGDWDGDGDFTSSDFVLAFQTGSYEQPSLLPAVKAIPEPSGTILLVLGAMGLMTRKRRFPRGDLAGRQG